MHTTIQIKTPQTIMPVADFITARFSPRAFSNKEITQSQMLTLMEAASWAASANNEQPWMYVYAFRGTEGFQKIWECLMPGNQLWAKNASALVVAGARKTYAKNGQSNPSAEHDLGMANANLLLQARAMDIFGHPMGGFYKDKTAEMLNLDENYSLVCIIALGYLGDADSLEEPYKTREITPRSRKPTAEFARQL